MKMKSSKLLRSQLRDSHFEEAADYIEKLEMEVKRLQLAYDQAIGSAI